MSGYEALLEDYFDEEAYQNETFSSISSYLESMTAFVEEEVNFNVVISLDEAVAGEIKDKAKAVKTSVVKGIMSLITKIVDFMKKIKEATKKYVAKANATIALGGNAAMKKMLGNNKFVIGKDVKVSVLSGAGENKTINQTQLDYIYNRATKAADDIFEEAKKASEAFANGEEIKISSNISDYKTTLDALSTDITKSKVTDTIKASENMTVNAAYEKYVAPYLGSVKNNLNVVDDSCTKAINKCKELKRNLEKASKSNDIYSGAIGDLTTCCNNAMRISTYIVNFSFSVLAFGTKNAAKIALVAVDEAGKTAAGIAKEKGKAAGKAIKNAPSNIKGKFSKKE